MNQTHFSANRTENGRRGAHSSFVSRTGDYSLADVRICSMAVWAARLTSPSCSKAICCRRRIAGSSAGTDPAQELDDRQDHLGVAVFRAAAASLATSGAASLPKELRFMAAIFRSCGSSALRSFVRTGTTASLCSATGARAAAALGANEQD